MKNNSTVIEGSLMENGAANLRHDTLGNSWNNQILDYIPRVEDGVVFKEVVLTWIARNL